MLNQIFKNRYTQILILIFALAIILRFLYFPQNIYFGFDQARDAFAVMDILGGDLRVVGPPTSYQSFNHGVLYYYIYAPFYLFSGGDPSVVSVFLRVLNALGIFLVYLIASTMFGRATGLVASFLFAISYEQTQFSLFLNHPSFVVISVLIFYLGLVYWIFRDKIWGLYLALFGLGLSIQFEFVENQLILVFILLLLFFKNHLPKFSIKLFLFAFISFFIPVSTYVVSEIKAGFDIGLKFSIFLSQQASENSVREIAFNILNLMNRSFTDNFIAIPIGAAILGFGTLMLAFKFLFKRNYRDKIKFLLIWFLGGFIFFLIVVNDAYFYNTGTSVALLILMAFLLTRVFIWKRWVSVIFLSLIIISNLYLITKNNPLGPNVTINPQKGLLLKDEEKVLDFIYEKAEGKDFSVNAITMPFNVNTTWSYLFEWYGFKEFGYLPIWGGDGAGGYPGNLKIERARSKLPEKRFLIIEPTQGIPQYLIDNFLKNESIFNEFTESKQIGTITVWVQKSK
ncbi:MAG: glycosyltransferase family 39 protein [Candidatus Daviesbacteria bacterium]|nr:glycosyltransferase family 39 protein [Candidatus Daviesbacteria bacterium]